MLKREKERERENTTKIPKGEILAPPPAKSKHSDRRTKKSLVSLALVAVTMSLTATEEEEDDNELRDLVTNVLDSNGVLAKIKAQLRANVYLALEDGREVARSVPTDSSTLAASLRTTEGRLLAHLVREYLSFHDLTYARSVFDAEANLAAAGVAVKDREQLTEGLGLTELAASGSGSSAPVLAEILRLSKVSVLKSETPTPTERTEGDSSMPSSLEFVGGARTAASRSPKHQDGATAATNNNALSSNASTPFSSLNAASAADKGAKGTGVSKAASPDNPHKSKSKPSPSAAAPPPSSSVLGELPPLSSSSSPLGTLPPLGVAGGAGGAGPRKTLAPLKKLPTAEQVEAKAAAAAAATTVASAAGGKKDGGGGGASSAKQLFPTGRDEAAKGADEEDDDVVEEDISEDLDDLLNSSHGGDGGAGGDDGDGGGISVASLSGSEEQFTKDESFSEGRSLRADYAEKI